MRHSRSPVWQSPPGQTVRTGRAGNQIKNNLKIQGFRNSLIPKFLNYETLILKYIVFLQKTSYKKKILWCNSIILCWLLVAATSFAETGQSKAGLYNECPECGTKYSYDIKFCGKDGSELVETQKSSICPKCKQKGVPGEVFCRADGEKLVTEEEAKVNEGKASRKTGQKALGHYRMKAINFWIVKILVKHLAEYKKAIELYENIPKTPIQYRFSLRKDRET